MKRREFLGVVGGAAAWPIAARAQQAMPVIGYLGGRSAQTDVPMIAAFREGLAENSYVEGQNVAIEYRWGEGQYDRLAALADDLVRHRVNVIVTSGGENAALAANAATATIPIVFNVGGDPVQFGLVSSLSRPGGNLTGVSSFGAALGAKQLGLLHELVPTARVIAVLVNPNEIANEALTSEIKEAARVVGQEIILLQAATEGELDTAFATVVQKRAGALMVNVSAFFVTRKDQITALASRHAVPTIYYRREFADAGGLVSYSSTTAESYRNQGGYAGRILKGEKPSDLPVLQPTKFELVINLKAAKALGLSFPNSMQLLADDVIE
jgi:putative tryptophan/tyrosine transport system substrate-binding protein